MHNMQNENFHYHAMQNNITDEPYSRFCGSICYDSGALAGALYHLALGTIFGSGVSFS